MATIASIVRNGKGSAGSGGAWKVVEIAPDNHSVDGCDYRLFNLLHHGTSMMVWRKYNNGSIEPLYIGTGWGSVSDQGGVNTALKVLGLPFYFGRKGGAEIYCTNPGQVRY